MKPLLTAVLVLCTSIAFAQQLPVQPIEERHHISYWWWVIGVIIALGIGIGIYMRIKKDPRKDAVR